MMRVLLAMLLLVPLTALAQNASGPGADKRPRVRWNSRSGSFG
jgi:hypothetical protein